MDSHSRWVGSDSEGAADLWAALEPRFEKVWLATAHAGRATSEVAPVNDEVLDARARRARDALARGFAGDFSDYEEHLRETARSYAALGLSMDSWACVTTAMSELVTKTLIAAHGADPVRLEGALQALARWLNGASSVLGTEYVAVTNASLRALAAGIESAREDERKHIAREIHDSLGQQLTGLKMDVRWLMRRLEDSQRDVQAIGSKLQSMSMLIDQTIDSVRHLGTELRPRALDDLGVGDALTWQARAFEKRFGIRVALDAPDEELSVDAACTTAIFRCFQELLTNVARHADARLVTATIGREEDEIVLEVRDDGRGITNDQVTQGRTLGLLGIRERVAVLGGTFSIGPGSAGGTTATIRMPVTP